MRTRQNRHVTELTNRKWERAGPRGNARPLQTMLIFNADKVLFIAGSLRYRRIVRPYLILILCIVSLNCTHYSHGKYTSLE